MAALIEEIDVTVQIMGVKVGEFNNENDLLREEFQRCNSQNMQLNKRILYYQEKMKLYQAALQGQGSLPEGQESPMSSPKKSNGFAIRLMPTTPQTKETPRE